MTETQKKDAKQRIFDSAVSLFARKGYHGVGIRELAKAADVQVSMVNYYYDGKVGILKEIINECYDKYYRAILDLGDETVSLDERVNRLTKQLVEFFHKNTELAIVVFSVIPVDIPEITDLRVKWVESNRESANKWFTYLGLDLEDAALMSVMRSFLSSVVYGFFESSFCCSQLGQLRGMPIHVQEYFKHDDNAVPQDAEFFKRYAEILARVYMYGVTAISEKFSRDGCKT